MRKPAKFIINSYNTMSAGTMNVTKSLLSGFPKKEDMLVVFVLPYVKEFLSMRSLNDRDDMKLVYVYRFGTIINKIFKVFFDFFIFPVICLVINPKSVFVLGNYAPFPSKGKKIVLVRHPYLIEKDLVRKQGFLSRVVELVRKAEFVLTLKFTDVLIVQSGYVRKKIIELYGFPSHKIVVLPNPKSSMIDYSVSKERSVDPLFLYISRYYPHKNHKFIIDLVEAYSHYFRAKKIKFVVTIDPKLGSHAAGLLEIV
jgi:glycosyltransferase involved in cell wall biosynthesis